MLCNGWGVEDEWGTLCFVGLGFRGWIGQLGLSCGWGVDVDEWGSLCFAVVEEWRVDGVVCAF